MEAHAPVTELVRQHLIDPAICIRCNTCEDTCPMNAVTHDARNYVVDFDICNGCGACLSPCPTGAIDNWRQVSKADPYTLEQQLSWDELPEQIEFEAVGNTAMPEEVAEITAETSALLGAAVAPPWSAAHPYTNLYSVQKPAIATVAGNYRLTDENADSEIHHIVLDFGMTAFPVLEGQNIGIIPPGIDATGKPHHVRMYSVASPRDGEKPRSNYLALTVKRVTQDRDGNPARGVASNYLCDLKKGDKVEVVGPYGVTYLMPNHPGSSLMMICTGTGAAPMRAMTERRRRRLLLQEGGELMLFFGARNEGELPYFGPLMKLPGDFINVNLAFSRVAGKPKTYVQDLIRQKADEVVRLIKDDHCFIYICGLKGMESGVKEAFRDVCRIHGLNWDELLPDLIAKNRLHVETY